MATFYAPAGYGAPMSGDQVYFYNGDSTTPATVYQGADLAVSLGTSATADSDGGWPNIYLDDEITYRAVFIRSGGDLSSPLKDTYPLNSPPAIQAGSITADMLADDAALDNLGYTPVNKAGDAMAGELLLPASFTTRDPKAAGLTGAGANNVQNGTYTFLLIDTRKVTKKTDTSAPTWTLPLDASVAFAENDLLICENNGASGSVTIARTSGVALYVNGSSSSADYTLAAMSTVALKKIAANTWRVL